MGDPEPDAAVADGDASLAEAADLEPVVVLVGCGAVAVGALLPWIATPQATVTGLDTHGLLTLPTAVLIPVQGILQGWSRRATLVATILGLFLFSVGFVYVTLLFPAAGVGLYLTLLGGLAVTVAGYGGWRSWSDRED